MTSARMTRREFAGALAAGWLEIGLARSVVTAAQPAGGSPVRFEVLDPFGAPVPADQLDRFHACDLLVRPIPIQPRFSAGLAEFDAPVRPFRVSVPLVVPGFGHVYVYADNRGEGYGPARFSIAEPLLFNHEAAVDRLATVRGLAEALSRDGIAIDPATTRRVDLAAGRLDKAEAAGVDKAERSRWSLESLRESLWAGEELVLARARHAIARRGGRPGFLFGANGFSYPTMGQPFAERFQPLFNFVTLPFYVGQTQPRHGELDYSTAEGILPWAGDAGLVAKGHTLVFFWSRTTPDWMKGRTPQDVMRLCAEYIRTSVSRFKDRIHVWDVVNELHDKNELGLSKDQMVELTGIALRAAREADPTCFRLVNNCCPWCEYMAREVPIGKQSIYDYLTMVRDAGIEYEAVGLQYYYYGRDMLEIERSIESFAGFGKPIHMTELGTPSSSEEIETLWPHGVRFPWHGERWSETIQADWIEQFYTISFSKPYVDAITWWNLADPGFVPHSGLTHADLRPKESYHRLRALIEGWRALPVG